MLNRRVELALRWEQRLSRLAADIDSTWMQRLSRRAPAALALSAAPSAGALLFRTVCGEMPTPEALDSQVGELALLPRDQLMARLVALALAGRPGVLRCCVVRSARRALEEAVGSDLPALRALSISGAPVESAVAQLDPMQWAWVGWRDLSWEAKHEHRSLRRMTRLMIPVRSTSMRTADSLVVRSRIPLIKRAELMGWREGSPWRPNRVDQVAGH